MDGISCDGPFGRMEVNVWNAKVKGKLKEALKETNVCYSI